MTTTQQLERYTLLSVFLLALLAIFGLVAMVSQGPVASGVGYAVADSGTLVGNAALTTKPQSTLFHYRSYDADERVIEFREIRSNMWFLVPLDEKGHGTIVYQGQSYAVQAVFGVVGAQERIPVPTYDIKVDTNRDGNYDVRVPLGKTFLIYYR